jgi:hypothetical protein
MPRGASILYTPMMRHGMRWMARNRDDSRPAAAIDATGARLFRSEVKLTDLRTATLILKTESRRSR